MTTKGTRVETTCLHCGAITMRSPCFADRKFCNRSCSNKYNQEQRRQVGDIKCPMCDQVFRQSFVGQRFCSSQCGSEGRKESRVWLLCKQCGNEYWRHRPRSGSSLYCSKVCKADARSDAMRVRRESGVTLSYDMSDEEYDARFAQQDGKCAICREPETHGTRGKINRLARDHCHQTGAWRGLLCGRCNKALGLFDDDADRLLNAVLYLKNGGVDHVHPSD